MLKLEEIEQRQKRIADIQRQKLELAEQKRKQQEELKSRKAKMLIELNTLLRSGEYKTKDDIYRKVFTEEELRELNQTNNSYDGTKSKPHTQHNSGRVSATPNNNQNQKTTGDDNEEEKKEEPQLEENKENTNQEKGDFFLTQQ